MKLRFFLLSALLVGSLAAQTLPTPQSTGLSKNNSTGRINSGFKLPSGQSLEVESGGTFKLATGSTADIADGSFAIADTSGLQSALDGKSASGHTHTSSDLTDTTSFSRSFLAAVNASAAKTLLALSKADVGLGNVDNTSDASKPVSTATQSALDLKAPLASPALTGTPTAPTAAADTNTTQLATTAYAKGEADAAQAFAIQRANHTGTQAWSTLTGTPTTLSGYGITDAVTSARTVATTTPLAGGGALSGNLTLSIANAAADGTTKGAATFAAADFDATSGLVSLDYTNGQKASASVPGFLAAADWSTFNGKQAAGSYLTALTGDVGATGPGSVAATIQPDAVTNAKLANMASSTIKGRSTAGTGDPEDLTAAQVRSLIGASFSSVQAKSADFTVSTADRGALFLVTTGTSVVVPTLPSAASAGAGFYFYVLKSDATSGYIYFSTGSPPNNPTVSTQNLLGMVFSTGTSWIFTPLGLGFFEERSYGLDNSTFWMRNATGTYGVGLAFDGIVFLNNGATVRDENDAPVLHPNQRVVYDSETNGVIYWDTGYLMGSYRFGAGSWTVKQPNEEELWPVLRFETARLTGTVASEFYQNRATTTNATTTTVHTVQIAASQAVVVHGFVIGHRTGGTSGAADDSAAYEVKFVAKNTGGTAALVGSATVTTIGESQAAWDVSVTASGSDILIRVTGAANNNVSWHFDGKVAAVGS